MTEASKVRAIDSLYNRAAVTDAGQYRILDQKQWVVSDGTYVEVRDSIIVEGTLKVEGRLYFK